jgi:hypothetical protein
LEIVFQNNDTKVQTYHIDGYAFWVVGWAMLQICISLAVNQQTTCIMDHLHFANQDGLWWVDWE